MPDSGGHLEGDAAPDPARRRCLVADRDHVEGIDGPRVYRQDAHRILAFDDHPPVNGRVVCVDEFGPLNLQPRKESLAR